MNKRLVGLLLLGALCVTGWAQDWSAMRGAWKKGNQYRFHWDIDDTDLSAVIGLRVDSGGTVEGMWEAWVGSPNQNGFSPRMYVSSGGVVGYAAQTFKDGEMHLLWMPRNGGGGGHATAKLSEDGMSMEQRGGMWVGPAGFSENTGPRTGLARLPDSDVKGGKTLRALRESEVIKMPAPNEIALFEPKLEPLMGRWHSTRSDGSLALEILWRPSCQGAFLVERYAFFDEAGRVTGSGLNISGKDPFSDQIVMWGNRDNGFHQKGGWDFQGDKTLIQREGASRLVRRLRDHGTIQAHWERKVNGKYKKSKDLQSYRLTKVPSGNEALSVLEIYTDRFVTAFNRGDLRGLEKLYAKDVVKVTSRSRDPLIGWDAVRADFEGRAGSADQLKVKILHASFLTPEYLMGSGEFMFVGPDGETKAAGKWGNMSRIEKGRCLMVQEAAFLNSFEASTFDASRWEFGSGGAGGVTEAERSAYRGSDRMIAAFVDAWKRREVGALVEVFHHSAIRSVSGVEGVRRNHPSIERSFGEELAGSAGQLSTELEAVTLGARPIGGRMVMAFGKLQGKSKDDGRVIEGGLWGNVFQQNGDQVKIVIESAGVYQP